MLFIFLASCFFWAWDRFNAEVHKQRIERVSLIGEFAKEKVSDVVAENIDILDNLRRRLEVTEGYYFKFWDHDADLILAQNPTFQLVEWIDSNMVIRKVVPGNGNEVAIDLSADSLDQRRVGWLKSAESGSINFTPWLELAQGGRAFLVDAPIYIDNRFWGTISAGMDFTQHVHDAVDERAGYHFHLFDHTGSLFFCSDEAQCKPITVDESLVYDSPLPVLGSVNWRMQLFPTDEFFDPAAETSNLIGLLLSLVLSLALAVVLFFLLNYSRDRKLVRQSNAELKEANEFLDQERKVAEKANNAKTEFLANMSHEIRTPLNGILGLVSILGKDESLNSEQSKNLELLEMSSKNLHGLLNNVLEIERIESGSLSLVKESFCPSARLVTLAELFRRNNANANVEFVTSTLKSSERAVHGDGARFLQVISNLLSNAFKFTESGSVNLSYSEELRADKLNMTILITDTGIGIPEEDIGKIFDRFIQLESAYKKRYEGSGLGLSVSKRLIELMGGSIEVKSQLGVGTTFTVQLSFTLCNHLANAEDQTKDSPELSEMRVLMAEDNQLNRFVMQKILSDSAVQLDCANDGVEALELKAKGEYDLIFMDLHMPEMDGFEAIKKIRVSDTKTPIIALSANATKEAIDEALSSGANEYVSKPVTRQKIEALLRLHWNK